MSTTSEAPKVSEAEWVLRRERLLLSIALRQQWDPWFTPEGQPDYVREWRGDVGKPVRVDPASLLLRVAHYGWMNMLIDPELRTWWMSPVMPERLAGVEVLPDCRLAGTAWRLVVRDDPETVRAEGTYGHA